MQINWTNFDIHVPPAHLYIELKNSQEYLMCSNLCHKFLTHWILNGFM